MRMYILVSEMGCVMADALQYIDTGIVACGGVSVASEYLRRFTNATTRRTMHAALDTIARELGTDRDAIAWHRISPAQYASVRSALASKHQASTVNKCMVAIRGCVRLAWLDGLITHDVRDRITEATPAMRIHRTARHGRTISMPDYHAVIDATHDGTNAGVRDVAILHTMRGGGLRRDEIAGIDVSAYDATAGAVHIVGKGNKPRTVYLPLATRSAIDAWLARRGAGAGALFTRINKADTITGAGMTSQAVYYIVQRRMHACAMDIRPHDLRRTYATHEARRGTPLPVLQRQLGHASLATTTIYMMIDDDEQARHAAGLML